MLCLYNEILWEQLQGGNATLRDKQKIEVTDKLMKYTTD